MKDTTVYIALGSNLGDRCANLVEAIGHLRRAITVEKLSSVYETEPAYVTDQPHFYNMVVRGRTTRPPDELLRFLKAIERRMGRSAGPRFGPRPIDLDILLYGDLRIQLDDPDLTIPHPRIAERAFVLEPLAEIAPDLIVPGQRETAATLARPVEARGKVVQVIGPLRVGAELKAGPRHRRGAGEP